MVIKGSRKNRRRFGADAYVFVVLSLVSFSILLFSTRSFVVTIRDAGLSAFSGVRGGIYAVSSFVSRTALAVQELTALRREYNELIERVTRYEQLERSSAEIRQENNRLLEQLGFSANLRYRHIPAMIIGRDPDNLFSALVINRGSRNRVKVNMPVIAFQNGTQALVGKIVQTGRMESFVMPLYDISSFISSRLAESRYEGIIEGQGNPDLPLIMRYIRKGARDEINLGDVIITSGLGGIYPSGIHIGRVSNILYQEYETSMGLELESAIDFSRLEYVFVIDTENEADDA